MKNNAAEKKNNDTTEKPVLTPMPPPKLERNPSIDLEPKTLSKDELNLAREEALKIINNHSKEEALKILLTGLKPVTSSKLAKEDDDVMSSDYDDE